MKINKNNLLFFIATPLLLVYVLLILGTTYMAQEELIKERKAAIEHDLEKRAATISYFYLERKSDIKTLSKDRSLSVYFSNKALGMSMQYGLRASQIAVEKTINQLVSEKQINQKPIYSYVAVVDKSNTIIAQNKSLYNHEQLTSLTQALKKQNPAYPAITVLENNDVTITTKIQFRNQSIGWVIATINTELVKNNFIKSKENNKIPLKLIQNWEKHSSSENANISYKLKVADTPFWVLYQEKANTADELLTSKTYLFSLSLLALLIIGMLIHTARSYNKSIQNKVRAEIAESQRQALETEVDKRKQSEAFLNTLIKTIPDLFWVKDENGKYLLINTNYELALNSKTTDIIGKTNFDLIEFEKAKYYQESERKVIETGAPIRSEETITAKDQSNTSQELETIITRVNREDGSLLGVMGISRNITERKQTEEQLTTLSQAVAQSPSAIMITTATGIVEYINYSFERTTGFAYSEVIGEDYELFFSEKFSNTIKKLMNESYLELDSKWQGEIENTKKDGTTFTLKTYFSPVKNGDKNVTHYLLILEDITDQKSKEEQIYHQAHYDDLTGLPNRFLALDRLNQLIKEAKRNQMIIGVLFVDLDDFKKVNDSMGHESGDQILKLAAARLNESIREFDTVGRLGGDEFLILLNNILNLDDIRTTAEKLLRAFREPFFVDNRELVLTTSIGISVYPFDGNTQKELLINSDIAMYNSKENGRNNFQFFTAEMNSKVARKIAVEEQLQGAISREEFTVLFQPIFQAETQKMIGAEALLRWQNRALGNVSPEEFIAIAENSDMISKIGEYVLEKSTQIKAEINKVTTQPFKISINLSPKQFYDFNLVDNITKHLEKNQITGTEIQLEITETVLLDKHLNILDVLNEFKSYGITIAMDDFGTGYSSLSYLRKYPFDVIKIDKSFIQDLTNDETNQAMIKASIAMSKGSGLKIVAEGVETEKQFEFLKQQQCDYIQGYYLSKPITSDKLLNTLKQNK